MLLCADISRNRLGASIDCHEPTFDRSYTTLSRPLLGCLNATGVVPHRIGAVTRD